MHTTSKHDANQDAGLIDRLPSSDQRLTFNRKWRDKVEGRKRWVTGRLCPPDGDIAFDAEGLFLHLLARSGLTWPTCGGEA
jgi:hypothetical protein